MTQYYFWLTQDKRFGNVQVDLSEKVVNMRSKRTGEIGYLPRLTHTVFSYNYHNGGEFDILDMGLFMVTDTVKQIFEVARPSLEYREFCVTSNDESCVYYHAPMIPDSKLKAERIRFDNSDTPSTYKIMTDKQIKDDIFKISDSSGRYIIVSLLVAEKLLQENIANIRLIPIEIEKR